MKVLQTHLIARWLERHILIPFLVSIALLATLYGAYAVRTNYPSVVSSSAYDPTNPNQIKDDIQVKLITFRSQNNLSIPNYYVGLQSFTDTRAWEINVNHEQDHEGFKTRSTAGTLPYCPGNNNMGEVYITFSTEPTTGPNAFEAWLNSPTHLHDLSDPNMTLYAVSSSNNTIVLDYCSK